MATEDNNVYQFSILNALMDGICEHGIPVSKILTKGNQGLGTFVYMDGELVMLDGKVYQLQPGGKARVVDHDEQIPFAMTTQYVPQKVLEHVDFANKESFNQIMTDALPNTENQFISYRIEGFFPWMRVRTVRGQEYKGQRLAELAAKQSVDEYEDIEGTIVGFRSPKSWQGFSVAGQHLHFLSKDRSKGGHVLEITAKQVKLGLAVCSNVHVELPTSDEYNKATLKLDDASIRQAEG